MEEEQELEKVMYVKVERPIELGFKMGIGFFLFSLAATLAGFMLLLLMAVIGLQM